MKVKIDDIIDVVDFDGDMSESFLNTKMEQVCIFTDEELRAAENDEDRSDSTEWYYEAVARAKIIEKIRGTICLCLKNTI
jgi:hypothetical protein